MQTIEVLKGSCGLRPPPKIETAPKKLVRRLKEIIKPTHARVRYDTNAGLWAVLNDDQTVHHHFAFGLMRNVQFQVEESVVSSGCGGSRSSYAGIAEGDLQEHFHGTEVAGFRNLDFDGEKFVDDAKQQLKSASVLRLMGDRRAMYQE